jgi:hypothetical protein
VIVISGALVLVALILLVIGLISTSLSFVYASIAVSVVSFVFLLVGILQRRGEQLPEGAAAEPARATPAADVDGVTAIIPAGSRAATDPPAAAETTGAVSGSVLVVAGRPRYHVAGCRYLTGKDADEVDVEAARDEGFTACGVCKPDAALAAEPAAADAVDVPAQRAEPAAAEQPAASDEPDPVAAARKTTRATPTTSPGRTPATSASKAASTSTAKAGGRSAAKSAPAKSAAKAAPAKSAKAAPAKSAAKAPAKGASKAAAAAAASTPAAASAAQKPGSVVVIPDRGKFHKPDCRFVRDATDAQELSRAQASRQGYDACGVCKP